MQRDSSIGKKSNRSKTNVRSEYPDVRERKYVFTNYRTYVSIPTDNNVLLVTPAYTRIAL